VKISSRLPRQFCYFDIVLTAVKNTHAWVIVRSIGFSKSRLFQARCGKPKPGHESVYPYKRTVILTVKITTQRHRLALLYKQPLSFFLAIFNDVLYANCDWSNLSTYDTYLYSMLTKLTYARFYYFVARYPEIFDSTLWHVQTTHF
jgi:hypothetical protein